jgi:hypothetical protein
MSGSCWTRVDFLNGVFSTCVAISVQGPLFAHLGSEEHAKLDPKMLAGRSTMPMCAQNIVVKKAGINRWDRYRLLAVVEPDGDKAAVLQAGR